MELSSAEIYVVKLQKYLASVLSSDSALYEKSKVRLRNLSKECHKAIKMIERILEENRLRSYGDSIDSVEHQEKTSDELQEFQYLINATNHVSHECRVTAEQVGGLGSSEDTVLIDDVFESLDVTSEFEGPDMDEPPKCSELMSLEEDEPDDEGPSRATHVPTVDFELRPDEFGGRPKEFDDTIVDDFDAENAPMMFPESSRTAISRSNPQYRASKLLYTQVLHQLAEKRHSFEVSKELSVLIWTWFSNSFSENSPEVCYGIKHFPRWIEDIVLLYAYRLLEGTEDKLIDEVRSWCGRTISEVQLSNYVLPPCVYSMDKSSDPQQFTLTAAVLYDLLLDAGLDALTKVPNPDFCLDVNAVFDRVASVNPSALDMYRHYSVDPEILVECRIISKSANGGDAV